MKIPDGRLALENQALLAGMVLALAEEMTRDALKEKIRELETREIVLALSESGWIKSRAARRLGITERMLNYRISKYGIEIKKGAVIRISK